MMRSLLLALFVLSVPLAADAKTVSWSDGLPLWFRTGQPAVYMGDLTIPGLAAAVGGPRAQAIAGAAAILPPQANPRAATSMLRRQSQGVHPRFAGRRDGGFGRLPDRAATGVRFGAHGLFPGSGNGGQDGAGSVLGATPASFFVKSGTADLDQPGDDNLTAIPLPASGWVLLAALGALAAVGRRRRSKAA